MSFTAVLGACAMLLLKAPSDLFTSEWNNSTSSGWIPVKFYIWDCY